MRCLEIAVLLNGESCPVISGSNGLRKIRFSSEESNRGKSGSFRVCFCLFPEHGIALMTTVFGKNEKASLNAQDRAVIAKLIASIQEALERVTIR